MIKPGLLLGTAYESDGLRDKAIEHYLKAIELNPAYSKAYGNLGKLYTETKNFEKAEDIKNNCTN